MQTKITEITDYWGKPIRAAADSGSVVKFSSGDVLVHHDLKPEALLASRVGDRALVCLVSVPRGCPPGDDRGKVYTATNLRTQQSWTMADSHHLCGGA
ncbi:hypothetical protein [Chelatococcus reniformis]|uniref:hypothetical protein n=1 Tax=Chelatococcus reniformis TaxID=1494448 RepID=UPI001FCE6C21|nr:hypothetical protein [Chelatococcus reniformis]